MTDCGKNLLIASLKTENSPVWYCNSGVGENSLSSFMSRLSKSCGLSLIYHNRSIRATGATIMSKNMNGAAQIMAVTGHKSVQSLLTYQRVDTG
jgi:integrase